MSVSIKQIINGNWRENCYIVYKNNGDALIIDPGSESEKIIQYVISKELNVFAILNTHAHYDHIGAISAIKDKFSVPFYLHSNDKKLLKHANLYRMVFDSDIPISIPDVDYYIDELATPIELGGFSVDIIFSPGHTQGSVCFLIEGNLFSGDTLFKGTIGRVDLPGGDRAILDSTLKNLSKLPPELTIYPGHGKVTTMLSEIQMNNDFKKAIHK